MSYTVKPKGGLRLRAQPSTSGKILSVIPQGSGMILLSAQVVVASGYHWMNVKYNGLTGWVAAEYLTEAPASPVESHFKFGVHVYPQTSADASQNANQELLNTSERLFNKKRALSFTILDDVNLANQLSKYAKILVYRPYSNEHIEISDNYNEAIVQGENWARKFNDKLHSLVNQNNIYIQLTNEGDNCDTKHKNFGAFNFGIMLQLEKYSRKGVIFNDSVGTPESQHITERNEAINYAIKNGHVIGYHAYGKPDLDLSDQNQDNVKWYSQRYSWLYSNYPNIKIVLNEAGRFKADFINTSNTIEDMRKFNDIVKNDNKILCVNWWQYNGQGTPDWNKSAFNVALPSIESMISNYI